MDRVRLACGCQRTVWDGSRWDRLFCHQHGRQWVVPVRELVLEADVRGGRSEVRCLVRWLRELGVEVEVLGRGERGYRLRLRRSGYGSDLVADV